MSANRLAARVALALVALAAVLLPAGRATAGARPLAGPPLPAYGAYLGVDPAFENSSPSGGTGAPPTPTAAQLSTFDAETGRVPAIVSFYIGFYQSLPMNGMEDAADLGALPMVSWHCGPPDASIAAGDEDGTIRADAEALKGFGRPVFLRFFPEMNLPHAGGHGPCLGSHTTAAAEFVAAWHRIWSIFQSVGASNVSFIWAPSAASTARSALSFYPGSSEVGWVGMDMYDRVGQPSFSTDFAGPYATYLTLKKPMMFSETGAPGPGPGGGSPDQVAWLQQIAAALPSKFPAIRAVVYIDAADSVGDYRLTAAGVREFEAIGRSRYFAGMG